MLRTRGRMSPHGAVRGAIWGPRPPQNRRRREPSVPEVPSPCTSARPTTLGAAGCRTWERTPAVRLASTAPVRPMDAWGSFPYRCRNPLAQPLPFRAVGGVIIGHLVHRNLQIVHAAKDLKGPVCSNSAHPFPGKGERDGRMVETVQTTLDRHGRRRQPTKSHYRHPPVPDWGLRESRSRAAPGGLRTVST